LTGDYIPAGCNFVNPEDNLTKDKISKL